MYIGKVNMGKNVIVSEESPNKSIVISGLSGTGKSERIKDIEQKLLKEEVTIIVADFDDTHPAVDEECVNKISAVDEGIAFQLLDARMIKKRKEDFLNYISCLAELLLTGTKYGDRQLGVLREAIMAAIKNRNMYEGDFEAIKEELEKMGTGRALGLRDKLWNLFNCEIFNKNGKQLIPGKINIISFQGMSGGVKNTVVELFLRILWMGIRAKGVENCEDYVFVVDEFQNLPLQGNSTVLEMLREGRKYGVRMILATQTLIPFSKSILANINQAAVCLYFRPARGEIHKIAAQIEPSNVEKQVSMLKDLRIGEAVAVGDFEVAGKQIKRPIITKTDYGRVNACCKSILKI